MTKKEYRNTYNAAIEQAVAFLEKNLRNICNDPFDYVMASSIYENKEDFIEAFKKAMMKHEYRANTSRVREVK